MKDLKFPKPKKKFKLPSYLTGGGKYGNYPSIYKGRTYHSKAEATYAMVLDAMIMDNSIKEWTPQFKLKIDVNGQHITNYIVDFWVLTSSGTEELHEVKGYETDVFKIKWKLAKALYGANYKFVLIK